MKIIYWSSFPFTDSDFPLLREYQKRGLNVLAFYPYDKFIGNGKGLINTDGVYNENVILNASQVDAFQPYADYLDLTKIYIVKFKHYRKRQWQAWIMWIKVFLFIKKQKADVLHLIYPLSTLSKILYRLKIKKVLTLHDPFLHSGFSLDRHERNRIIAINNSDKIILLNEFQKKEFQAYYHIPLDKIVVNKMGEFDYLNSLKGSNNYPKDNYILFFGQIQEHKGIDGLLEAMLEVHKKYPEIKIVIAGKGNFSFDITPYEKLEYVEIRNYYITVSELAGLLQHCMFAVCPYRDATQSGVVQTAFSATVPLVVSNVGTLPEIVKDGIMGLVFPPRNSMALADSICKLLKYPELLDKFRKNIDELWRPTMKWKSIAEKYIQCYEDCINNK